MQTTACKTMGFSADREAGFVSLRFERLWALAVVTAVAAVAGVPADPSHAADAPPLAAGIIGLDTSHAVAFTGLLHKEDPAPGLSGVRVVAAYPQGSRDIESSVKRVPEYTEKMRGFGVEIVDSIPALLERVDVVLLESNDGRVHLEQAVPVLAAKKPLFIDKPMTASLADAIAIFAIARHHGTPVFSASALRYGPQTQAVRSGSLGTVLGCDTHSPYSLEPTHPDLFWYGIHGCESLFTVMGPGCESVSRTSGTDMEVVTGLWSGGRIGTF
ncbi:MAG: Gfo/Idh/MocA family oxidoreductase, partial [Planctomycetia bacterium]